MGSSKSLLVHRYECTHDRYRVERAAATRPAAAGDTQSTCGDHGGVAHWKEMQPDGPYSGFSRAGSKALAN